jgi:hypothetical protein
LALLFASASCALFPIKPVSFVGKVYRGTYKPIHTNVTWETIFRSSTLAAANLALHLIEGACGCEGEEGGEVEGAENC